jgi:hypothetical protein
MIKIGDFKLRIINTFKRKNMTIKVGEEKDWKFGIINRTVLRISEDEYEINDFSDGWKTAIVNHETFEKLTEGKISLETLNWE